MTDRLLLADTGTPLVITPKQLPALTIPQYAPVFCTHPPCDYLATSTTIVMNSCPSKHSKRKSKKRYSSRNTDVADKSKDEKKQPSKGYQQENPRPNESQDRQGMCLVL